MDKLRKKEREREIRRERGKAYHKTRESPVISVRKPKRTSGSKERNTYANAPNKGPTILPIAVITAHRDNIWSRD